MASIDPNTRYHCQWPEGFGDAEPQDVDPTFFNDDNGYGEFELAAIEALEVGETYVYYGAAHEKHTITRVPDQGDEMFVRLESIGNADFGQDPNRPMHGVPPKTVRVESLLEASTVCRAYITEHGLGGGNWSGGLVTDKNDVAIAEISYNGRIWPGGYTDGNASLFKRARFGPRM